MQIQIGNLYINKTWKYLMPCLKGHGEVFVNKFNPVFKLAVGIHDTLLDGSDTASGRNMFILCDKKYQERSFNTFLNFLEYQPYFKSDYCPDSNINSRKHMIMLSIPEEYNNAYDQILKGNYSKMYTEEQLLYLFSNPTKIKEYNVMTKHSSAVKNYEKLMEKEFGEKGFKLTTLKNVELEMPLKISEEIFNCQEKQRVFFNEEKDKIWA